MSAYREPPPVERPCPRCGRELERRSVAGDGVDACATCGGAFVAGDVLAAWIANTDVHDAVRAAFPADATPLPPGGPMYIACPRCQRLMNRRQFGLGAKVIVDVCREHGTWFDPSELGAVIEWVDGGGLERAREREAAETAERARAARAQPARMPFEPPEDRRRWNEGAALVELLTSLFRRGRF